MMAGIAVLVVVLVTRDVRIALWLVLPTVLAMVGAAGASAMLLMRHAAHAAWVVAVPAAAAWGATMAMVALLAAMHGRTLAAVLARPVVERGLMGAPLLGALIGASLLMLERARQRELAACAREAAATAKQEQLQLERAQAHLRLLQAQIEPHFLYNTLANLRQLVRMDSARALSMLDHLIRYFKLVLPSFNADVLPLADELALSQTYLDLLRERMDRPMRLVLDVPAQWMEFPIPPGALLCLVENSIKHGLPEDGSELQLQIGAYRAGEHLCLIVRDNGPGPGLTPRPGSTGLANLRERLRLQYGDDASLRLRAVQPGCETLIQLPWET